MKKKTIENIYPLSPLQQGILFHTLYAPASGVYVVQTRYTLRGHPNLPAYQRAWEYVVNQHPVLRTSFQWEDYEEPFQVVYKQVQLPWQKYDWRGLSPTEQQERLDAFLQSDRSLGFDLAKAPLMRFTLIELGNDTYQFVWSKHHLILDGWSTALVLKDVFATYKALCCNQNLPSLSTRPYADYLVWLQQQDLSKAQAFWQEGLKGFTAPTPLRIGSHLLSQQEAYGEQSVKLSKTTTAALQSLARQHQLTLNTLLQGAWAILLSRYSGEEDVVFGATSAGRPPTLSGAESMIGLFINTLPVRVEVCGDEFLLPWLQKLQTRQAQAHQYEYSPLTEVQGWSDVPRDLPLFDSILVFENYPIDSSLREWESDLEVLEVRSVEQTNYPITVTAGGQSELLLQILYDGCRFDRVTVNRMLGHLKTLLEGIVANPNQHLSSLPMLTETEQRQLLTSNPHIPIEYPSDSSLHQRFEAQVQQTPDAIAVVFEGESLTYSQLNQRANQLARYLQKLGIGAEGLVGICLERSLEMVIGILGILKAGGAYVPLEPTYPKERLNFILQDAQVPLLLTEQRWVEQLLEQNARIVCLDTDWAAIAQESGENITNSTITTDSLAYVIYTSGSTGQPKGTLVQHGNVLRLFDATQDWFHFNPKDVWTLFHSYAFDFSVWELWGALLYGGRVVIVPYWVSRSPDSFYALLSAEQVTVLNQTPSAFSQLIQVEDSLESAGELALRLVILGGEALNFPSLKPWFERHGDQSPQLVNMYGITETTVHVTYRPLTKADLGHTSGSAIGRPIPDLQVYLLDQHQQLVPVGVPGEIHVGGAGLARGYLNQTKLTAQKFIPNPFSIPNSQSCQGVKTQNPPERLYKTGDLARYLPNGELEYLGRIDHQVKIRGFRIELGEIEAVLTQHPAVQDAVVMVQEDEPNNKRLVAYVVHSAESIPTIAQLRDCLKDKLPEYMVPAAFALLETLPLTPNGKVDRQKLSAAEVCTLEPEKTFIPPQTPTEKELAELWATLLGVKQIGRFDNFFDLGGHSLVATQLMARIKTSFGAQLSLQDFFSTPTISALAEKIEATLMADSSLINLDELLDRVEAMNDDEAHSILASHESTNIQAF